MADQDSYTLIKGNIPLLISMPHNGEGLPDSIKATMTKAGKAVADTDWYMDLLYDFAEQIGAYILKPKYSRYVIDLNRDPNGVDLYPGAQSTELCPTTSFSEAALYLDGQAPDEKQVQERIPLYWQPYHHAIENTLNSLKQEFGRAVLLDAHSIASRVPRFFDGQLPDFNLGTNNGVSCANSLINTLDTIDFSPYSKVVNGRFKGGYITRAYADVENNIHTVQLELSQRTYLEEPNTEYCEELANKVKPKLAELVNTLARFSLYIPK